MTWKVVAAHPVWDDPKSHDEDPPVWTDDQLDRAELAIGRKVDIRSAV